MFSSKYVPILCWVFSKGLYSKLGWGFIKRRDICFNVRIGDNRVKTIRLEKGEEVLEIDDLKQIFPL